MDRLLALMGAAAAGVAGVVGVLSLSLWDNSESEVADPSFGMSTDDIERLANEHDAPLVLPVEIPRDYGWSGVGREAGDGQRVWSRTSFFTSVGGGPTVELCAKGPDQREGCEMDDDPWVVRRWQGLDVFISFEPGAAGDVTAAEIDYWESAQLTTDYGVLTWTS